MMHGENLKPNQLHVSATVSRHHQADPNYIKAFKHITSAKVPTKAVVLLTYFGQLLYFTSILVKHHGYGRRSEL